MSDPKPLTLAQFDNLTLAELAAHWPKVRATVEALERAEKERDEWQEWHHVAVRERDALKAALRELADMAQGLDVSFFDHEEAMQAEAVLQRAREALGEVEK